MSLKISQYTTSVSALASGDLMDVSKLISTSPDVYSSDKLNYSVLLTEIIADGSILTGSGTTNYISKFSSSGTLANSSLRDDGSNVSINNAVDASYKLYINSDKLVGLGVFNNAVSGTNNFGISGSATNANTGSNIGVFGNALLSSAGTNLGVRGMAASETVTTSPNIVAVGSNVGGFFQANASSGIAYGLVATADATTNQGSATFTGAYIRAHNAGTKYSVRLVDGSEGTGKFLKSVTSIGQANWAALAITDITASLGTSLQVVRMNAAATALEYATLSVASINLGNANLTADAAQRIYKLYGNTSGESLDIQNNSGSSLFLLNGNGNSRLTVIGTGIRDVYHGANVFTREYGDANYRRYYNTSGTHVFTLNPDSGYFECLTAVSGITAPKFVLRGDTSTGSWFVMNNNSGGVAVKHYPASYHFFDTSLRVGGTDSADSSQFLVFGKGSTSATTNALFQNSSSVNSLKIRDDNYVIQRAINAAIPDADLSNNEMSFYIDEGTNHCVVKVKYSSGTVKTGTFNLT